MSEFYDRINKLALRLITKFGTRRTLGILSSAAADPDKPWSGQGARIISKTIDIVLVFINPDVMKINDLHKTYSRFFIAYSNDDDVKDANILIDNNITYAIEQVADFKPADTNLIYYFGIKR